MINRLSFAVPASALCLSGAPLCAQQQDAVFDAPVVVFPDTSSIDSLADLNGDGHMDGLGWYWDRSNYSSGTVRGFLNDGKGSFKPGWSYKAPIRSRLSNWNLETGRFNKDGRDDFIATFNNTVTVHISSKDGSPTVYANWSTRRFVAAAAILDYDKDGLDDLVLSAGGLQLYHNTGKGFQLSHSVSATASQLFVAELNGDGHLDILARSGAFLRMYTTRGKLVGFRSFFVGLITRTNQNVVVGDIDQDKDADICVFGADGEYVVHRRTGPNEYKLEAKQKGGPATGLADIDGDGDLDGVCCGGGGPSTAYNYWSSTFHLSLNDGKGNFQVAWQVPSVGAKRLAGAVDIDGDGDVDLIAGRSVMYNQNSFVRNPAPFNRKASKLPVTVQMHDVDGDADPDLMHGINTCWRNDGTGQLRTSPVHLPAVPPGHSLSGPGVLGDFDGDGDLDAVAALYQGWNMLLGLRLLRNSGGAFRDAGWAITPGVRLHPNSRVLFNHGTNSLVADIDGDKDLDILAGSPSGTGGIILWRNDGSGFFTKAGTVAGSKPRFFRDMNNDGHPDLVSSSSTVGVKIFPGDGKGGFGAAITLGSRVGTNDRFAIADITGDKLPDIAVLPTILSRRLDLWINQGKGTFTRQVLVVPTEKSRNGFGASARVYPVDVDGDGDQDLILGTAYRAQRASVILFNDGRGQGKGSFARQVMQVINPEAVVDVDGDGDLDSVGMHVARSTRRHGDDAGWRRQYGAPTPGTGGVLPRLGARGPIRTGETMGLVISGARPNSAAVLVLGPSQAQFKNWPVAGLTGLVAPISLVVVLPTSNTSTGAGEGRVDLSIPLPASAHGLITYNQVFVLDAGSPRGLAQTNGLLLRVGK